MSQPDNIRDLYELYALGLLEEPELSQVEEELRSGSTEARARLRNAMENNAIILANVPVVEPGKGLRARVIGSVGAPAANRHWMWVMGTVAAGLLIGVIYLGTVNSQKETQLAEVRGQMQSVLSQSAVANAELRKARQVLSFLNSAETKVVTFGPKDPKPPRGRVLLHPNRGVVLIASNLPPAPAGKIYEMWVIRKGRNPVPAGLFQTDADGNGIHIQEGTVTADVLVAVTLEPESGSAQPTTTPLFAAGL
ncbi:MAG: anti-sigma factor [Candidatus Solibacter usitatus]|nr:anti-sigma factor [Candidatus Solibacter usitatus]